MHSNLLSIVATAASLGVMSAAQASFAAQPSALVEGNTEFALDLYAQFKNTPGNMFFSPYSISTCLAMTYAGARGETQKQMSKVLRFGKGGDAISPQFGELQRQFKESAKEKGIELNVANALWAQKDHPFLPEYLKMAKDNFEANIAQADFKTAFETARNSINQWVAEQTKDKIQNILPPGSLGTRTRLVLANAIYFKGAWAIPFLETETSLQPFHLTEPGPKASDKPGSAQFHHDELTDIQTLLMHHEADVRYMENDDFQAVELPYNGRIFSMVVLLPRQISSCVKLEEKLNSGLLSDALARMKKQKVDLFLPKFKAESSFELKPQLVQMGLASAFGPEADFSGMDGSNDLYVSDVFHKAWVEVNEEGTEAAAATVVLIQSSAVRQSPPVQVFRADHPFIFLIRDTHSGSLLFMGRLAVPG